MSCFNLEDALLLMSSDSKGLVGSIEDRRLGFCGGAG